MVEGGIPLHRIQKWLGHTTVAQTSTYLMADSADDDRAMRQFEERQGRLQPVATDSETGHQEQPRSAEMVDTAPQLSLEKHH
jgi:hypothetical protein